MNGPEIWNLNLLDSCFLGFDGHELTTEENKEVDFMGFMSQLRAYT